MSWTRREGLPQTAPLHHPEGQLLHRVEPVLDALHLHERPQDPLPQEARAHGGPRLVEDVEERALASAVGLALDELEVAAGRPSMTSASPRPLG